MLHASDRPEIIITSRQLRDLQGDCIDALRQWNRPEPRIFSHGRKVVHIADEHGHMRIRDVNLNDLRTFLTQAADFVAEGENRDIPAEPPNNCTKDLLYSSALFPLLGLPHLKAISEIPFLREDGTVVQEPGYDVATGIFYHPAPGLRIAIPTHPTQQDSRRARDLIVKVIAEFLWADDASLANAQAMLLAPVIRPSYRGCCPLFAVDAPRQGSGKGLLVDVTALIGTGSPAALRVAPKQNEDEWRKAITAAVSEGTPLIIFDNVTGELNSDALASAITAESVTDRLLGKSKSVTAEQQSIFIVNGNHITLGGDYPRRTILIRLKARSSNPWFGKEYAIPNLQQYVLEHRAELLGALLTMQAAWYAAGRPKPHNTPDLGSFNTWCQITGGILEFAGCSGLLGNLKQMYEDQRSDEELEWERYFEIVFELIEDKEFSVHSLVNELHQTPGFFELSQLMPEEMGSILRNTKLTREAAAKRIAALFRKRRGTPYGTQGLYIDKVRELHGTAMWAVRRTE